MDIIPTLTQAWSVSFEINPYSSTEGWTNIVHFTTGNNIGQYGFRVPAVFVHTLSSRLHICSAINGNHNHCFNSKPLPLNSYTRVEIQQQQEDNTANFLFTIRIGGEKVYQVVNKDARFFPNVKVYKADPWYNPATSSIKDFVYRNLPSGKSPKYLFLFGSLKPSPLINKIILLYIIRFKVKGIWSFRVSLK